MGIWSRSQMFGTTVALRSGLTWCRYPERDDWYPFLGMVTARTYVPHMIWLPGSLVENSIRCAWLPAQPIRAAARAASSCCAGMWRARSVAPVLYMWRISVWNVLD